MVHGVGIPIDLDRALKNALPVMRTLTPELVDLMPGDPVLVETRSGDPAYWIVPLLKNGVSAGVLRLTLKGELISVGSRGLDSSSAPVNEFDAAEALLRAKRAVSENAHAEFSDPRLIVNGYRGREAWLIEVKASDQVVSLLLVSSGGVEELGPSLPE